VNRLAHAVVLRALPRGIAMRFDASAASDLHATIELAIRDPADRPPRCFSLAIADSRCEVRPGPEPRAGARALVGADDLIALVRGTVTWPELISSGRFELSGDPFLALRFASLFRLPVRLDPV
jgi:alkyl sulfatase BDS1-like metallo-beta-lactamase superfamily hydrolase